MSISDEHVAECLRHEAEHPGSAYINDEWGGPSPIGSVLIYRQYPWRPMRPEKVKPKVRMKCRTCGSEDVARDASVVWDSDAQKWIRDELFDKYYCYKCEGETSIVEEVINVDNSKNF